MANILTGQHFGTEGNRAKLMAAMNRGLISEPQYKTMSGYDARKEMGMTPFQTLQASGIYNTAKGVMSPQDFEGRIGPIKSTLLNTIGSTGYGFDKDQYEGIIGLNFESLSENPYGSGLLGHDSQSLQKQGLAPAYDFDYPPGIFGEVDDERGSIAFDPNKINKAGLLDWGWAGPGPYLLNQGIGAGLGFLRSKFQKGQSRKRVEDQRKQIQEAQVQREANQVRQNIQTYGNRDRPDTGMNRPGGGRGRSPTGGNVAGTPFARGGLIDLYRYGGFI